MGDAGLLCDLFWYLGLEAAGSYRCAEKSIAPDDRRYGSDASEALKNGRLCILPMLRSRPRTVTDSMRMFQWGIEGGRPAIGAIGIAPEWFYKGDGSTLRAPFDASRFPAMRRMVAKKAELAGDLPDRGGWHTISHWDGGGKRILGSPIRKTNYLNLAGSKLRPAALGRSWSLILISAMCRRSSHRASAERLWQSGSPAAKKICATVLPIWSIITSSSTDTGNQATCTSTSLAPSSLLWRRIVLQDGDWIEVRFEGFGSALRNPIQR